MNTAKLLRILTFLPLVASADEVASWDAVVAVHRGTRVEVIHGNLKRVSGTLVDATDDRIEIATPAGNASVARSEVRRFSVFRKSRTKGALLGAAIGAGLGAAALAIGASAGDVDIRRDLLIGAGSAIGAAAGAIVGAASSGPDTVYRAP